MGERTLPGLYAVHHLFFWLSEVRNGTPGTPRFDVSLMGVHHCSTFGVTYLCYLL